jgi:hypothetical protein
MLDPDGKKLESKRILNVIMTTTLKDPESLLNIVKIKERTKEKQRSKQASKLGRKKF